MKDIYETRRRVGLLTYLEIFKKTSYITSKIVDVNVGNLRVRKTVTYWCHP